MLSEQRRLVSRLCKPYVKRQVVSSRSRVFMCHTVRSLCARVVAVELAVLCRQSKALLQSKRIAARISSKEWTIGRTKVCVSSALCAAVRHLMVTRPSHRSSFVLAWRVCWT